MKNRGLCIWGTGTLVNDSKFYSETLCSKGEYIFRNLNVFIWFNVLSRNMSISIMNKSKVYRHRNSPSCEENIIYRRTSLENEHT